MAPGSPLPDYTLVTGGSDPGGGNWHYHVSDDVRDARSEGERRDMDDVRADTSPFAVEGTLESPADKSDSGAATSARESATAEVSVSAASASRLLGQAGFGGTDEGIAEVQRLGLSAWIEAELGKPQSWRRYYWLEERGYRATRYRNNYRPLAGCIWRKLVRAPDVLRQRTSLALSEIFVINPTMLGASGGWKHFAGAAYLDLLDEHAFGNFRDLLGAVTRSLQMGVFLSMRGSRRDDGSGRAPDENFARELLQLFTIGLHELNADGSPKRQGDGLVESFDQQDITELARVFTGWDVPRRLTYAATRNNDPSYWRRPMLYFPEYHDTGAKRFLGAEISAGMRGEEELDRTLDIIFKHPNVGPFIGRQLIQRLVTSNPSSDYVQRVAAAFDRDPATGRRGELPAVLRAILLDPEARADESAANSQVFGKVREPILRFVQWARTFRSYDESGKWDFNSFGDSSRQLGQSPLRSPSVFNFFRPGYVPPNSDLARMNTPDRAVPLVAPELQIIDETSVAGYTNFMVQMLRGGIEDKLTTFYTRELAVSRDASALVARLDLLFTGSQLRESTRTAIVETIDSMRKDSEADRFNRVRAAIILVMTSPDYLVQR